LHSSLDNRTSFRIKFTPTSPSAQAQYPPKKDTHTLIPSAFVREVTIGIVEGIEVENDLVFVWYRGERKAAGILLKRVSVCCIRLTRDPGASLCLGDFKWFTLGSGTKKRPREGLERTGERYQFYVGQEGMDICMRVYIAALILEHDFLRDDLIN
jgi:hypothetical protein